MTTFLDLAFALEIAMDEPTIKRIDELSVVCSGLIIRFQDLESIGIGNFSSLAYKIIKHIYDNKHSDFRIPREFFDEYTALINKLTDTADTCFGLSDAVLMYTQYDGSLMWCRVDYKTAKHQFIEIVFHPFLKVCEMVRIASVILYDEDVGYSLELLPRHPDLLDRCPELFV